jgi:hypothetical protein
MRPPTLSARLADKARGFTRTPVPPHRADKLLNFWIALQHGRLRTARKHAPSDQCRFRILTGRHAFLPKERQPNDPAFAASIAIVLFVLQNLARSPAL